MGSFKQEVMRSGSKYPSILSANAVQSQNAPQQPTMNDDLIPDYMNILGMIFSMCALMLESNGQHGWPFTVPAFHLPTQNSTMIPSKLCQALCCQFLLLLCLTCKILLQ